MTHHWTVLPSHHRPMTLRPTDRRMAVAFIGMALTAIIVWAFVAVQQQCITLDARLSTMRAGLAIGMTRSESYTWLQTHALVATNPAYGAWSKNGWGVWYLSSDGAWPTYRDERLVHATPTRLNHIDPSVFVRIKATHDGCAITVLEELHFDQFERIERITNSAPYWTCQ